MWKKLMKLSFIFALALILAKPMVVQAAEDGTSWDTAKALKMGTTTIVEGDGTAHYFYYKNTSTNPVILDISSAFIDGERAYPYLTEYQKIGKSYDSVMSVYSAASTRTLYSKVESGETVYYRFRNGSVSSSTEPYTGKFNVVVSVAKEKKISLGQSVVTTEKDAGTMYTFTAPEEGIYSFDCVAKSRGYVSILSLDHKYWVPIFASNSFSGDDKVTGYYLIPGCQYALFVESDYDQYRVTWNVKKASNLNNPAITLQTIQERLYDRTYHSPNPMLYYKGYDIVGDLGGECGWSSINNNVLPGTAVGAIYYSFTYEGSTFSGYYYTTFRIVQDIGVADVTGITTPTYTGKPVAPKATVKVSGKTLKEGVDYKIVADSNVNAGAGRTATIQGLGKYSYTKKIKYTIAKGAQSIQCDGEFITHKKAKKFALGAKANGTLTYATSNGKVATVDKNGKVKPKKYGKAVITISAAATSNVNATSKKITVIVTSKATKIASVKSTAKKKATVKIKKATGAQGYEISYSMDPNFKSGVKTVKTKKASTTLKKLKSKKTYYVRVRSYRKVKGEKLYSTYSAAKKVKIK